MWLDVAGEWLGLLGFSCLFLAAMMLTVSAIGWGLRLLDWLLGLFTR